MKIDDNLLNQICKNARLKLTESENNEFKIQLNEIMDMFNLICEVDTNKINPIYHPIDLNYELREDIANENKVEIKKNTIHIQDGFFIGPKIK
ncbi:Asp-tRNA(Asn)/Glu-tRNA(Gln) amidotransferase subunit GatC [Candidatus Woesearchaeota archaeon]|jgi:aspartyl/glutamyl-tRNA(Asn/Gln) amidotransferase C subunit|nr:Asp-tRNA(Asn)/Glu-tRNA(Gln) amidotransferase subunit GatC [Candidatus Woesearchaeota archaeon]MBT4387483.1 Asp-tRNA(Asn)/Glu-tRNA(Gln) amidotransferase subunit GatC [Candidatus Woesearchaeota archaeon]MBT4595867.1 Asp-tRNA(Asn)/Glu-tRNA(Gln) amidotransferase subunit GatC [Candidatus Woesearchaeota archaeon]MBT5741284.1 Asp-tRNA(Asn)/Glu-tRNA(Gln) amidotransferase subunit GatC [Candidatus Woesearchaeota archaeon]MBT6505967.1 Asp-tRNA(Asn)/Glu-tRNA(Gln) amidotransferase subunit GatC [Candidatu